jgi:hypothetical protein
MLSDGSVRESYTDDTDYVHPGHKYFLLLLKMSESEPDIYRQGGGWEISDGIAHSVFTREAAIAKRGRSSVEGLSEADAIQRIERLLSKRQASNKVVDK